MIVSSFLMQSIIKFGSQRLTILCELNQHKTPSFLIAIFAEKIRALLFILYASTSVNYYFPFFPLYVFKKGFLLSLIACVHKIFILKKARTWCILSHIKAFKIYSHICLTLIFTLSKGSHRKIQKGRSFLLYAKV